MQQNNGIAVNNRVMVRDFTLNEYKRLLATLGNAGYRFLAFEDYLSGEIVQPSRFVILRHDIDKWASRAIDVARIEKEFDARASYYFRVVPESNQPNIMRQIVDMGFELGYHYEDMSICHGDAETAKAHFERWLGYFREFYPVRTICMHGAPQSKWDSRTLWKMFNYRDWGIIGEPYFDVDFSSIFYLTDTGRRWDGHKVSVRDKIPVYQEQWVSKGWVYHTTQDIIGAARSGALPKRIMMTTHPQRWHDTVLPWIYEYGRQRLVNAVKYMIAKTKTSL